MSAHKVGSQQPWYPGQCSLLPIIRDLIERAYFQTSGKGNEGYQVVWMPDLPIGPPKMRVVHDCRSVPVKLLQGEMRRMHSIGHMNVYGEFFLMNEADPFAGHHVYSAACHNCKIVFFSSAWDREDTMENYVKKLKCG